MARFYYVFQDQAVGPVTESELREAAFRGFVTPSTLVCTEPSQQWVTAASVRGLFEGKGQVFPHPMESNDYSGRSASAPLETTSIQIQAVPAAQSRNLRQSDLGILLKGVMQWLVTVAVIFVVLGFMYRGVFMKNLQKQGMNDGGWVDPETGIFVSDEFLREVSDLIGNPQTERQRHEAIASLPGRYSESLRREITLDDLDRYFRFCQAIVNAKAQTDRQFPMAKKNAERQ